MPELPDVELYLFWLRKQLADKPIQSVVIRSPFVLRTFEIDVSQVRLSQVQDVRRIGKKIIWCLDGDLFLVFHLMITGRFHIRKPGTLPRTKRDLAAFGFEDFTVMMTEAATRKRASIHLVRGEDALLPFDRGGLDVLACSVEQFKNRICQENRTVKLSLIDPTTFDGIGNAYSDEILHAARLSPFTRTSKLADQQIEDLWVACRDVLTTWKTRLISQNPDRFPEKVTAFRPEMSVHGKFNEPCPVCSSNVQRIVYTNKEWNYCATCQTGGRLLADRSLSRLLRDEWPKTIEEIG